MKKLPALTLTCISLQFLLCIPPAHSEEPCANIPAGWTFESRASAGVLCADVLLESSDEGTRKLRVFESGILGFETADAALCKHCGGLHGDPLQGIKWVGQTLSVDNVGGSREMWSETWKFAKRDGRWVAAGWDRYITDTATGAAWSESVNALTGKATANYSPGENDCAAASGDDSGCMKKAKLKPQKLACAYPTKMPNVDTLNQWRTHAFACGLKTP